MKAIKRTVAALLATLMLATSTSFTLAAEEYSKDEAVVVGKVNAAGIMTGTDKGFEPSKSLTRAEAAAIIVRMKGISESAVKATAGTTLFNDVAASHWASGYVNQASNLGIVKGVSATEFAPDREVTIAEFTTMAVRALGAGQLVDSEGTWPTNYVNFANENGILDDVNSIYTATATRLQAATIVANTLDAAMWEKVGVKSNGEIEWGKAYVNANTYKTILNNVLKLYEDEDDFTTISIKDHLVDSYEVNENVDLSNIKKGIVYHYYANIKDDEIQGFWIENDSVEFTAINKGFASDKITLSVDGKDKTYKVETNALYYKNEDNNAQISTLTADDYKNFKGSVVLNNKNEIEAMYITEYTNYGIVKEVTKSTVKFETVKKTSAAGYVAPTSLRYDDENVEYFLTKAGKGISFADLEKGDAVAFYKADSNKKVVGEVIDTVEGKVSTIGSDYIKLDNEKIKTETFATADAFSLKDEIIALKNNAGKIVAYKLVEDAAADTAVVSYFREVTGKYASTSDFEIKLTYSDGKKSDVLTLDLVNTYNKMAAITGANNTNSDKEAKAMAYFKVAGNNPLGKVYGYSVSGNKVTLKDLGSKDHSFDATDGFKLSVNSRTMALSDGTDTYFITDDTKVLKLRNDDTYNVKVEVVKVDDLDSIDTAFGGYVLNVNSKNEASFVVLGNDATVKRTAETNFVFIKSVNTVSYTINEGKDDEEDVEATELVVFTMDGSEETLLYVADEADNSGLTFTAAANKGTVMDLVVVDDKIMDVVTHNTPTQGKEDLITDATAFEPYLKEVLDTRIVTSDSTDEAIILTAEKVIAVIEKTGNKYELSTIDDIDLMEAFTDAQGTDHYNLNDTITKVWSFVEDGESNALVVVFSNIND